MASGFDLFRLGMTGGGERAYSFVACLSHLTIDHASLSRRSEGRARGGGVVFVPCVAVRRMTVDPRTPLRVQCRDGARRLFHRPGSKKWLCTKVAKAPWGCSAMRMRGELHFTITVDDSSQTQIWCVSMGGYPRFFCTLWVPITTPPLTINRLPIPGSK